MIRDLLHVSLLLGGALLVGAGCGNDEIKILALPKEERPSGPAVVRLVPSRPSYHVGERVHVQMVIDNAWDVGSVSFGVRYDAQVVVFVPPGVEGPFMGSDGAATAFLASDAAGGGQIVVGLSRISTSEGISGSGTLAMLEFDALALGDSGFAFAAASVKDPQARILPAVFTTIPVRVE